MYRKEIGESLKWRGVNWQTLTLGDLVWNYHESVFLEYSNDQTKPDHKWLGLTKE